MKIRDLSLEEAQYLAIYYWNCNSYLNLVELIARQTRGATNTGSVQENLQKLNEAAAIYKYCGKYLKQAQLDFLIAKSRELVKRIFKAISNIYELQINVDAGISAVNFYASDLQLDLGLPKNFPQELVSFKNLLELPKANYFRKVEEIYRKSSEQINFQPVVAYKILKDTHKGHLTEILPDWLG